MRIVSLLSICLGLAGCALLENSPEKVYYSQPKVKKVIREKYFNEDTLHLDFFIFDSYRSDRLRAFTDFPIDTSLIINHCIREFASFGLNTQVSSDLKVLSFKHVQEWEIRNPKVIEKLNLLDYDNMRYNFVPYYYLKVYSDAHRAAGWGGYPVPTSKTLYRVVQCLDIYLVRNDSLYYSNSFFHSDTLIQENDVPFKFEFQPEVLDSLISLTMHDFRQRLR